MGLPCQDIQVRNLFKKIAEYRKLWKLQEQEWLKDDESPGDHGDDDCDYVDDNPDASPSPDGSISTPPVLAGVSEGSPEMEAIDTQLAELGIGGGTMTPAQKAELASVLAGIEEMKIRSNSTCIPYFSCMSILPNQNSGFCIPAG